MPSLIVAFGTPPRIVASPMLLAIEALALFLARHRTDHMIIAVAMLIEVIPIGIFSWHLAIATVGLAIELFGGNSFGHH
jgi:hypothetical protein